MNLANEMKAGRKGLLWTQHELDELHQRFVEERKDLHDECTNLSFEEVEWKSSDSLFSGEDLRKSSLDFKNSTDADVLLHISSKDRDEKKLRVKQGIVDSIHIRRRFATPSENAPWKWASELLASFPATCIDSFASCEQNLQISYKSL